MEGNNDFSCSPTQPLPSPGPPPSSPGSLILLLLFLWLHVIIDTKTFITKCMKTISLNRKVHDRDIQHAVHFCLRETVWLFSLEVFKFVVFPSSYFQKGTPWVNSYFLHLWQPGLVRWCTLAPSRTSPKMVADCSTYLHIFATGLELAYFLFLFNVYFNDYSFEFVAANWRPSGLRAFDLVSSRVWWEAATNTRRPSGWLLPIHSIFKLAAHRLLSWLGFRDCLPFMFLFISPLLCSYSLFLYLSP